MHVAGADHRLSGSLNLGLIAPIALIGAVTALVAPVSPLVLDLLLAANVTASVLILLQTLQVRRPLEFSVFPALLLTTTLFRLVLNVASTRLILTEAPIAGAEAAGGVIQAFGDFVAAGSPYVGGVIFAILVAIQFLVITKGSTRISEVAARFALDGMPGRQAAVDADLAAGLLTAAEARERRQEIVRQADFYGAMDGASKFVRGDAVAGLLITGVNILGGLAIAVLHDGMDVDEAVSIYTTLTIGDGLVSQVPALLISLAAGLIVTRSSTPSDLSREAVGQIVAHPLPLLMAAGFLAVLAFAGFPPIPMLALAACCCGGAYWLAQRGSETSNEEASATSNALAAAPHAAAPRPAANLPPTPSPLERRLHIEPLELDLGVSLVRLADPTLGGDLLERVTQLRERIAADLGFILPKVRIQDDLRLDPREFKIKVRGVPETSGAVYSDSLFAVNDGFTAGALAGIEGVEPASGRSGVWIAAADVDTARQLGYRVITPHAVVLQKLEGAVRRRAADLLTHEHVHHLLQHLRQRTPHLVDELIPARISGSDLHRVLCDLLAEDIPIRDLESILEAIGQSIARRPAAELDAVVRDVRIALRRTIVGRLTDASGVLHVVLHEVTSAAEFERDMHLAQTFHPDRARFEQLAPWSARLTAALARLGASGRSPVVLCRNDLRFLLRDLLRQVGMKAAVLGHRELPAEVEVKIHAEIRSCRETDDNVDEPIAHGGQAAHLEEAVAISL